MTTTHVVSHTHWDREWYRTFQQFRIQLVHLVDNLLAILEDEPDFKHFMLDGQTIVLNDYLEIRPERMAELRKHIQNGRILVGPWYILPDEFLVSPESTIRNLIEGDRDSRSWGPKMHVGYLPDTFGHIGQMPQILTGFGLETACLWRGLDDQPCEMLWQSPDGSQVLLANMRNSYSNGAGLPADNPQAFTFILQDLQDNLKGHSSTSHTLVMFGTDHMEPPPNTGNAIKIANEHLANGQVIHSTLPKYLSEIKAQVERSKLPVAYGELRSPRKAHLLPGVLSTRMWIKQRNHACETLLERWAEPFSTWASLVCEDLNQERTPYQTHKRIANPTGLLHHAWRLLMQNHPHDSICGCSVDQVHDEMRPRFDQVEQVGEALVTQSLEELSRSINTGKQPLGVLESSGAVIVFNAATTITSGVVTTRVLAPKNVDHFELIDVSGKPVPFVILSQESPILYNLRLSPAEMKGAVGMIQDGKIRDLAVQAVRFVLHDRAADIILEMAENAAPNENAWQNGKIELQKLIDNPSINSYHVLIKSSETLEVEFLAREVPGLGYKTFWLRESTSRENPSNLQNPSNYMENDHLRATISIEDGTLSVLDHQTGTTYDGMHRFIDGGDCGDEYNYAPPSQDTIVHKARVIRIRKDVNLVRQTLSLDLELDVPAGLSEDRQSRLKETKVLKIHSVITLYEGARHLEVHTEVMNTAKDHRLRVHFPTPIESDFAEYDGHFEIVRRPIGLPEFDDTWAEQPRPEVPQRAFTTVRNEIRGLMVSNRGLPEVEVLKNEAGCEIALTLLRCVGWLSRDDLSTRRGHAGPNEPTPGAQNPGLFAFDYAIIPHGAGQEAFLNACQQAYAFQTTLRAVSEPIHSGTLPPSTSLVEIDTPKFAISAIKPAEMSEYEEESAWIVRGYNLTDQPTEVKFKLWNGFGRVDLANLAENPLSGLEIRDDGSVSAQVGSNKIITLRIGE